ncbi:MULTISPECIES: DoxX family protein [unclassified Pseudarthrobacter]|uniref:DoxX family protein n=1 Tax=unclassified Pseudarthrobacter TaxID=2647000 RepID=UPI0030783CBF
MTTPSIGLDLALLLIRIVVGGTIAAHGAQKLFGWFGGKGLDGSGEIFSTMGFEPGRRNALMAGLGETFGGLLMVVGLGTPAAAAAAASTMVGAAASSRDKGFWAVKGGYEYPLVLATTAACISIAGPGRYSVDEALGNILNQQWMSPIALVAAAAAITAVLLKRRAEIARRAQSQEAKAAG